MKQSTICAIATPVGMGSVSIVRLSGPEALQIALKIFKSKQPLEPRRAVLGNVTFDGISDKSIAIYFKAPYSFTGEDIVEFQCHGGMYLTESILNACLKHGAQLANKGEFSLRAFMNGKISLDEAEGIVDTINAESHSEVLVGQRLQKGYLKNQIDEIQANLTSLLAKINLSLDYPEHDDEVQITRDTGVTMLQVKNQLQSLLKTESAGKAIRNGIQVAIIGKPNVGKSSVLNALIGSERAIVSDIAGTTRDIVTETILHKGFKIKFSDTAGIRESVDTIEQIGIQKSKEEAALADVVLAVFDSSVPLDDYDKQILKIANETNSILVLNKSDTMVHQDIPNAMLVSAKKRENIDALKDKIVSYIVDQKIDLSGEAIINARQAEILKQSVSITNAIIESLTVHTLDIIAFQIKDLWDTVGGITGKTDNENIIDEIFSKFCVGK